MLRETQPPLLELRGFGWFEFVPGILVPHYLGPTQAIHDQPPMTMFPVPREWFSSAKGWPMFLHAVITYGRPFSPYDPIRKGPVQGLLPHVAEPMRSWQQLNVMRDQVIKWLDPYPMLDDYLRVRWKQYFFPDGSRRPPIPERPDINTYPAYAAATVFFGKNVSLAVWVGDGDPPATPDEIQMALRGGFIQYRLLRRTDGPNNLVLDR